MAVLSIALTLVATFDVLRDESCHAWPPVVAANKLDGSVFSGMSRCKSVVTGFHNILPKLGDIRDVESTLVIDEAIIFFPSCSAIS